MDGLALAAEGGRQTSALSERNTICMQLTLDDGQHMPEEVGVLPPSRLGRVEELQRCGAWRCFPPAAAVLEMVQRQAVDAATTWQTAQCLCALLPHLMVISVVASFANGLASSIVRSAPSACTPLQIVVNI